LFKEIKIVQTFAHFVKISLFFQKNEDICLFFFKIFQKCTGSLQSAQVFQTVKNRTRAKTLKSLMFFSDAVVSSWCLSTGPVKLWGSRLLLHSQIWKNRLPGSSSSRQQSAAGRQATYGSAELPRLPDIYMYRYRKAELPRLPYYLHKAQAELLPE
jgi:hypothetical protein